jgi:hypothetical protein
MNISHEKLHVFQCFEVIGQGIPYMENCHMRNPHPGNSPFIHKGQKSNSGMCARTVTLCIIFMTCLFYNLAYVWKTHEITNIHSSEHKQLYCFPVTCYFLSVTRFLFTTSTVQAKEIWHYWTEISVVFGWFISVTVALSVIGSFYRKDCVVNTVKCINREPIQSINITYVTYWPKWTVSVNKKEVEFTHGYVSKAIKECFVIINWMKCFHHKIADMLYKLCVVSSVSLLCTVLMVKITSYQ